MERRSFLKLTGATAAAAPLLRRHATAGPQLNEQMHTSELLEDVVDAAMSAGAQYADARALRHRVQTVQVRKDEVFSITDNEDAGIALTVYRDGGWATVCFSLREEPEVKREARRALELAGVAASLEALPFHEEGRAEDVESAWSAPFEIDPFEIGLEEKVAQLRDITAFPLSIAQIPYAVANLFIHRHEVDFVSSRDVKLKQTFHSLYQNYAVTAFHQQKRLMDSRSSPREARAGGWELMRAYQRSELDTITQEVLKKQAAEGITDGTMDIVLDATVFWDVLVDTLLPHLDVRRMLQRDGNRPGTPWLRAEDIGSKVLASEALTVEWDNTLAGGLATCGWDDAGRAASKGTLIERGRVLAVPASDELPLASPLRYSRSGNWRVPAQLAMPNLVVRSSGERNLQQLIGAVESGLLVRGRGSIVTNPGRTVFRLRPQVGWRIQGGEVKEMVRDFEIEMPVEAFWKQLVEIGSPREALLAGELFPERSYPLWTQPFSVSTPPALFTAVSVFSSKESA